MPFSNSGFEEKWSDNDDESKLPSVSAEELKERKTQDDKLENMSLKLDDMELIKIPPQLSHVNFYPFQTQGITWLVANETCNDIPSFWRKKHIDDGIVRWKSSITKHKTKEKPHPIRGIAS